jgi:mannose-1-phosphate guanylyltransferase
VIIIGWEPPSTRFRPFSISLPPPLFPIGGYPLIFHHIKALSNLSADLKNVFLMGSYDEKKFRPFLDYTRTLFNFKIHYLQEEIPNNSAGALFFFRE